MKTWENMARSIILIMFKCTDTYVHFPPTPGQVEEERYFEFPECLEVLAEAFAWKLFEGILITLRCLLHLPLLLDKQREVWLSSLHTEIKS